MGQVVTYKPSERIALDMGRPVNDPLVKEAVQRFREAVRQSIKDSFWQCPIHGEDIHSHNDCEECYDCLDVNTTISSILRMEILKDEENSSHSG